MEKKEIGYIIRIYEFRKLKERFGNNLLVDFSDYFITSNSVEEDVNIANEKINKIRDYNFLFLDKYTNIKASQVFENIEKLLVEKYGKKNYPLRVAISFIPEVENYLNQKQNYWMIFIQDNLKIKRS